MRRVPPGAVVVHRGRRSGHEYRTPVLAWATREGFVIALTYGRDVDWLANVAAADGCRLIRAGQEHRLVDPEVRSGDAALAELPAWIRPVLRTIGTTETVRLRYPSARSRAAASAKSGDSSATRRNS
jgi:deazaflavin-dependent oxidoreductase (nitroreductase family)